jgi:hypothetical protein
LQPSENLKRLIKELGNAINESLSESEKIGEVMNRIRAAGYDLFLVLEVTVGFNKRGDSTVVREKLGSGEPLYHLTNQDAEFLRALKINVDDTDR